MRERAIHAAPRVRQGSAAPGSVRESAASSVAPLLVIEPRRGGASEQWRELWRRRRLVGYFGRRFLAKRYARTWLGWLWLPLRPGLSLGSRALVFGGVLGISAGRVPYLVFFLVASAAWHLFAETSYWATRSLELSRRELRQMYVPRLVPLLASVVASSVTFVVYIVIALSAVAYYMIADGTSYLVLGLGMLKAVAGLALLVAIGVGIGLWTATYAAQARDIRFGLNYALGFWYFLTPVIYPVDAIPDGYRFLASLNPVTAPVELVKDGLLGTGNVTQGALLTTFVAVSFLFAGGIRLFARLERAALEMT